MKRFLLITATTIAVAQSAHAEETQVTFVTHIEAGLPELDVYLPAPFDDALALQVRPDTYEGRESQMLYAASEPIPHNPFDAEAGGPFPKGATLGLTLGDWLAASGSAQVECVDGVGRVQAQFAGLVPDATYTLWYAMVPMPPTVPFTGALDLPLGARDGSDAALQSDGYGTAAVDISFAPCLVASNEQVLSMLALAWHSDGETYGSSPGDFGLNSHVQIFAPLPISVVPES